MFIVAIATVARQNVTARGVVPTVAGCALTDVIYQKWCYDDCISELGGFSITTVNERRRKHALFEMSVK